jgi:uncharacterized membrane protein
MGVNLLIPKTAVQLPSIVAGTSGFLLSFTLIAFVWWVHHRLFRSFFVLAPMTVILNFAMLASLVLMVYFQQITLHFIAAGDYPVSAARLWLLCFAVAYALLAAMLWIGLRARWAELSAENLQWGLSRAVLVSLGTLILLTYGVAFERLRSGSLIAIPLVVVGIRVVVPWAVRRLVERRA